MIIVELILFTIFHFVAIVQHMAAVIQLKSNLAAMALTPGVGRIVMAQEPRNKLIPQIT